ncbi:toll-like receptor 13 [Gigantopelta aegis]|uniref:toll-like receptor 13 n=1 Tax=Gigantopelta aegis TaxID=1735272 RepID=UPI001B887668|nr:toll-like receptor 13 [Gigantopelta aegis]
MTWLGLLLTTATVVGGLVHCLTPSLLCPSVCECNFKTKTAICGLKTHGLSYIPAIPGYVRRFALLNGNISTVDRQVMSPVSKHRLLSLTLATSQIRNISEDVFEDFQNLTYLDLRENSIPVQLLQPAFRSLGDSVRNVVLRNMNIRFIPFNLFQTKNAKNIKHLDMGNNDRLVAEFCRPNGSSVYSHLGYINLQNTGIQSINSGSFSCLNSIRHIELSENPITVLGNNSFSNLPRLNKLHLMKLQSLKTIEELAFNSTSLEELILSGASKFRDSTFPGDFPFKWAPRLMQLQLQRTRIGLSKNALRSMLLQLKSITYLNLQKTWLYELPPDTLGKLPNLIRLDLQGNYLPTWSDRTFANVTRLQYLNLAGCRISTINETSFPVEMLKSIKKFNLGSNPFFCNCDLLWFRTWMNDAMRNKSICFVNYPRTYYCKNLGSIHLNRFNPTHASCVVLSPYIIAAIAVSAFAVVLSAVSLVVYRNRWNIRYCMYSRRRCQYQKLPGRDTELKFDAFVSFDSHDIDWMMTEVCSFLENDLGLKLCIHRRDFEGAKMIIDNIMDCMEQSKKTILVVSNDFARSHWCRCEVQLALYDHFKNGKDVVIVIREPVTKKLMFKSLKALFASTTYIQWEDSRTVKEVFRCRLAKAMGCRGVNI